MTSVTSLVNQPRKNNWKPARWALNIKIFDPPGLFFLLKQLGHINMVFFFGVNRQILRIHPSLPFLMKQETRNTLHAFMCYICIDERNMWPQHSVRKWEVRKANMTGNNLLQKKTKLKKTPKQNKTRWFVEPLYHFLHAKKNTEFIPVRDTQKEQWGQTRPPCFKQEYGGDSILHAITCHSFLFI